MLTRPVRWDVCAELHTGQGNAVHSAASPRHAGSSADSLLGAEPKGRCGGRRRDVGCLRAGPGGHPPGSARSGPPRRLPGETIAKGVHTEGGRAASAARHRQLGGQDPPAGRRRGVERRLRGGLPRLLLWFPARGSPHDALDALAVGIEKRKVNWILDADIRGFYDAIDHGWMRRFVEHRIADKRVLRLIQKWLDAGVIEDGKWSASEEGAPQGATISPLLANLYLHHVFDLWARQWRCLLYTSPSPR